MAVRYWLVLCAGLCAVALAEPPSPPASASAPSAGTPGTPLPNAADEAASDDEFIEFLGADDVGDSAWWEFLKKSAPGRDPPKPATPPQDAKS